MKNEMIKIPSKLNFFGEIVPSLEIFLTIDELNKLIKLLNREYGWKHKKLTLNNCEVYLTNNWRLNTSIYREFDYKTVFRNKKDITFIDNLKRKVNGFKNRLAA